jgi:hypothetical protein
MFSNVKSTQGNTRGQVFTNDLSFTKFIGIQAESQASDAVLEFANGKEYEIIMILDKL